MTNDAVTLLLQVQRAPLPSWAAAASALPVILHAEDDAARAQLVHAECVLLDASDPAFVSLARRTHALDASVQVIAVTPANRLQATRRALLYAPGLGEVWVASAVDVTGALAERAAGVTRQRRRFERTRARIERERLSASPQRSERALISDAYLAGLLGVLPDPVFSVDAGGRVLSANAAAESLFDAPGHPVVGARLADVAGLTTAHGDEIALLEQTRRGEGTVIEFRTRAGAVRTGELRAAPMEGARDGAWAVLLRDITEQQATYEQLQESATELEAANEELQSTTEALMQRTMEAEHAAIALRESEATFRALANAIPALTWTARADGYIDWYNQRWYDYTGATPAQVEGSGWRSVHDPEALPAVLAAWQKSIDTGLPFEMTFPLRSAAGEFRAFLTRAVPLRNDDGAVIRWFGTNTDVETERRSRERIEHLQKLTAALAATRTLEEVSAVVVAEAAQAMKASTTLLIARPPGATASVIVQGAGLEAEPALEPGTLVPLDSPYPIATCIRTGSPIFVESREGPDGLLARFPETRPIWDRLGTAALASVPLAAGGDVVGALAFTFRAPRSFSADERAFFLALGRQCAQAVERARLFAAEREARDLADEANRAKSAFLATMSHELRTPLNAISGYVGLLREEIYGPVTPEQRTAFDRVLRAQSHLLGLINDVLSFARIESGHVDFHLDRVSASDVVDDVLPLVEPQLSRKHIAFEVVRPEDSGHASIVIQADREKLAQIFVNLLSNAIKFTEAGGRIRVELTRDDGRARLSVSDSGVGIPPDRLESIFEPFVQLTGDRARMREGTGLGLAISRDLARGMGGDLVVESTLGAGSTFTILLPTERTS